MEMEMDNIVTEEDNPRGCCGCMKSCCNHIKPIKLLVSSLVAVVLGVGPGFILKYTVPEADYGQVYIIVPGQMLMRLLQAFSVPLVMTNLMTAGGLQKSDPNRKHTTAASSTHIIY